MTINHVSVHHVEIEIADQVVAEAISMGEKWVLFTTQPDLADLDGMVYANPTSARRAALSVLAGGDAKPGLAQSA
ncbi:MAG: hypothetical protein ACTSX7_17590 [Alphaproteobacteria bacterium]